MRPHQLRDDQWDLIKDILPGRAGSVGVTAADNRRFVDAVIHRYRTGIPWRDLPESFGDRCGQRICDDRQHDRAGPPTQRRCKKKAGEDQAIGKSKGGLSTKIHVLVDALGHPLKIVLTKGQAHDLHGADALLPGMAARMLLADKAYDVDKRVIEPLNVAGKIAVIPPKSNRKTRRSYNEPLYEARHLVENFFCWAKQFRAIATRYDKTARNFLAAVHMVGALSWLN